MKSIILSFLLLSIVSLTWAQQNHTISLDVKEAKRLNISTIYSHISLKTWDNPEVEVRLLSSSDKADLPELISLSVESYHHDILISSQCDPDDFPKKFTAIDKNGNKIEMEQTSIDLDDIDPTWHNVSYGNFVDLRLEIYVPRNLNLEIDTKYGNVSIAGYYKGATVKSTYGFIDFKANNANDFDTLSLHAQYDFIDLSLPSNSNFRFEIENTYGETFSDLEMSVPKGMSETKTSFPKDPKTYILNNGDRLIEIVCPYDSVYIRAL